MNQCKLTECQGKPRCAMCVAMDRRLKAPWPDMPQEPPPGLLMSMAIRFDHGLGVPGYYDELGRLQAVALGEPAITHAQRLESTLRTMRQLYEEVSGYGFYSKAREAEYAAMAGACEIGQAVRPGDESRMTVLGIKIKRELFRFRSQQEWVNKAQSRYASCGVRKGYYITVDANGHVMHIGKCFMEATRQSAYPVTCYELQTNWPDEAWP